MTERCLPSGNGKDRQVGDIPTSLLRFGIWMINGTSLNRVEHGSHYVPFEEKWRDRLNSELFHLSYFDFFGNLFDRKLIIFKETKHFLSIKGDRKVKSFKA